MQNRTLREIWTELEFWRGGGGQEEHSVPLKTTLSTVVYLKTDVPQKLASSSAN